MLQTLYIEQPYHAPHQTAAMLGFNESNKSNNKICLNSCWWLVVFSTMAIYTSETKPVEHPLNFDGALVAWSIGLTKKKCRLVDMNQPKGETTRFLKCFFEDVDTLPETNSKFAPENRPFNPKGKYHLPTIHFQVQTCC